MNDIVLDVLKNPISENDRVLYANDSNLLCEAFVTHIDWDNLCVIIMTKANSLFEIPFSIGKRENVTLALVKIG